MKKNFWINKKILITGSNGFVGKNLHNYLNYYLKNLKCKILIPNKNLLNFLNKKSVDFFFRKNKPDYVFHLAGKVGGINANRLQPANFLYENLLINTNILHACNVYKVKKVISLGAGCAYADKLKQPLKEKDLWTGLPNYNLLGYSISKRVLSLQSELYNKQYKLNSVVLLPANIYGPYDNFDSSFPSVMPSLIKKFIYAKKKNLKQIEVWGDGSASREFVYIDDLILVMVEAMEKINSYKTINVGSGKNYKIKTLVKILKKITNFEGEVYWNKNMPTGQKNRLFDKKLYNSLLNFRKFTDLEAGIKKTVDWYCENKQN